MAVPVTAAPDPASVSKTEDMFHNGKLPDISKNSSRTLAVERAIQSGTSKYGEAITEKNPLEDRHLCQTIQKLENDKKAVERSFFWNQRQFFMDNAFDENQELKFVKLKDKILGDLSGIDTHLADKYSHSAVRSADRSHRSRLQKGDKLNKKEINPLMKKIFPVSDAFFNRKKDSNYVRLQQKERQLKLARETRRMLTAPSHRKSSQEGKLKEAKVLTQNPMVLPILVKGKHIDSDKIRRSSMIENGGYKEAAVGLIRTSDVISAVHLANNGNTADQHLQDKDLTTRISPKNQQITDLETSRYEDGTHKNIISEEPTYLKNRLENLPKSVQTGKKLSPDELLLKLTTSLPMHMLLKTDETLNDLSTALGYSERNKKLKKKEETKYLTSGINDERFKNLQAALVRSETDVKL